MKAIFWEFPTQKNCKVILVVTSQHHGSGVDPIIPTKKLVCLQKRDDLNKTTYIVAKMSG